MYYYYFYSSVVKCLHLPIPQAQSLLTDVSRQTPIKISKCYLFIKLLYLILLIVIRE